MYDVEVDPNQLKKFTKNIEQGEFKMLNLLKFKKDGGKENYARYLAESGPFAKAVGASVEYLGIPKELLTGKEDWDLLLLVNYPSRKAFLDLITNPGYLKAHEWRKKAVERAVLYPTTPSTPPEYIKSLL
ncbi:MAG: DUF1330 domain-containing protein [Proteobacteria bacterium]|nr:DUF1330 domain-containing protein [Pseudomonadota bacterium]MBU1389002.1 DUF1330 domain-containing protein [Pseudomonadota bacterium]MBU1543554.1 DUF1330 domain-containing protein [Pseudomonadota bacterium]MBU2429858.1 DUF1330 domain-containing protein [Pseudomonadota bacterium]MBU2480644.1 DUF1330 domain-containing protein [Pseudomonadota bacterium]